MVVQDEFLTFTATFRDVVLPASPSLEKDGTFTNTERRIQRLYKALDSLGDSKPDWEIFQLIANRLGRIGSISIQVKLWMKLHE